MDGLSLAAADRTIEPALSVNLWSDATQRLRDKDKASLDIGTGFNLDDLLRDVEKWRRESKQRRLKVRTPKGELFLYDTYAKIAKWIKKFVEVGDVAVQYDPGHAALPWAAVRIVLQVSINSFERTALLQQGVERICELLTWSCIYEKLYLRHEHSSTEQIQRELTKLYTNMLAFLAKAVRYSRKSSAQNALESLVSFNDKYESLLSALEEQQSSVERYATLARAEMQISSGQTLKETQRLLLDALDGLHDPVERLESTTLQNANVINDIDTDRILEWVSDVPYIKHHTEVYKKVMPGTGEWLLVHDTLLDWQRSSYSEIVWLHGIPGSGKTSLVSILNERLVRESKIHGCGAPIHFYCKRNSSEPYRSDPVRLMRALLCQLSTPLPNSSIPHCIRQRYTDRRQKGEVSFDEAAELIIKLLEDREITYILLDALDECDKDMRPGLLTALERLLQDSPSIVKIFVSSRDDQDLACALSSYPNMFIKVDDNQRDVDSFIEWRVDSLIDSRPRQLLRSAHKVPLSLRNRIKRELSQGSQGMFRWVELQLQFLCTLKTQQAVENRLGILPKDLAVIYEDVYSSNMTILAEEEQQLADGIFHLLLCSKMWLTAKTVAAFLAAGGHSEVLTREQLLDLTFNMVVHDDELKILRFAHLSVREFLEGKTTKFAPATSNSFFATACLTVLLQNPERLESPSEEDAQSLSDLSEGELNPDDLGEDEGTNNACEDEYQAEETRKALLQLSADFHAMSVKALLYSISHWSFHTMLSGEKRHEGRLYDLLSNLITNEEAFQDFSLRIRQYGSRLGLKRWIMSAEVQLSWARDPIFMACAFNLPDLVELRLARSPKAIEEQNEANLTPLACAVRLGHIDVVKVLLAARNLTGEANSLGEGEVLDLAASAGNVEIAKLLLEGVQHRQRVS